MKYVKPDKCTCCYEGKHVLVDKDCPVHIMPEDAVIALSEDAGTSLTTELLNKIVKAFNNTKYDDGLFEGWIRNLKTETDAEIVRRVYLEWWQQSTGAEYQHEFVEDWLDKERK